MVGLVSLVHQDEPHMRELIIRTQAGEDVSCALDVFGFDKKNRLLFQEVARLTADAKPRNNGRPSFVHPAMTAHIAGYLAQPEDKSRATSYGIVSRLFEDTPIERSKRLPTKDITLSYQLWNLVPGALLLTAPATLKDNERRVAAAMQVTSEAGSTALAMAYLAKIVHNLVTNDTCSRRTQIGRHGHLLFALDYFTLRFGLQDSPVRDDIIQVSQELTERDGVFRGQVKEVVEECIALLGHKQSRLIRHINGNREWYLQELRQPGSRGDRTENKEQYMQGLPQRNFVGSVRRRQQYEPAPAMH